MSQIFFMKIFVVYLKTLKKEKVEKFEKIWQIVSFGHDCCVFISY